MKQNTLLDFILSTADPQTVGAFWEVLGAGTDKQQAEKLLKKVIDLTEKDAKIDNKDAGWLQRFFQKYYGKSKKSVLDMDPAELKNLLQVVRREEDQFKIDTVLDLEKDFVEKADPQKLVVEASRFYNAHKSEFSDPDDISFDPESMALKYNGPKDLAAQFMKDLGMKDDSIKEILAGQHEQKFIKPTEPITLQNQDFVPAERYEDFRGACKDFKLAHPRDITLLTFDPETGNFDFTMNAALLPPFLKQSGVNEIYIEEIMSKTEKTEMNREDNTTLVFYVIPITELGEDNKKSAQDALNIWLQKNGHTQDMAKIGKENPDKGSPDALLFTGHPAELKNLLREGFAVTDEVREKMLQNKEFQRSS